MRTGAAHAIQWKRIDGADAIGGVPISGQIAPPSAIEAERLDGPGTKGKPKNLRDGEQLVYQHAGARKKGGVNMARRNSINKLVGI